MLRGLAVAAVAVVAPDQDAGKRHHKTVSLLLPPGGDQRRAASSATGGSPAAGLGATSSYLPHAPRRSRLHTRWLLALWPYAAPGPQARARGHPRVGRRCHAGEMGPVHAAGRGKPDFLGRFAADEPEEGRAEEEAEKTAEDAVTVDVCLIIICVRSRCLRPGRGLLFGATVTCSRHTQRSSNPLSTTTCSTSSPSCEPCRTASRKRSTR